MVSLILVVGAFAAVSCNAIMFDGMAVCGNDDPAADCLALCDLWNATGRVIDGWCSPTKLCDWGSITCEDGRVSVLSLSNQKLTGQIPESLTNLSTVTDLRFGENLFSGPIPASIGRMTKLSTLVLHDNMLTGTLPSSLGDLSSLTQLVAFNNQFTGEVPDSLGRLTHLEALALFNNKLTSWSSESVCALMQAGTLSECSLARNPLKCPIPSCSANCSATCSPAVVSV